jgi:hypothetical protein
MEGKRKPKSEEDVLREYERKKKEEVGPLGAPAISVANRSTNYGSLSQFQKEEAKKVPAVINPMPIVGSRRRRRVSRKTRRQGRRGGRRT